MDAKKDNPQITPIFADEKAEIVDGMSEEGLWAIAGGDAPLRRGRANDLRQATITIRKGEIAAVEASGATEDVPTFDAEGCIVLPGFVDVHVHGADGCDTMDGDPANLARMARFFARHGVTSFLPTTMTASAPDTLVAVKGVAAYVRQAQPGARVLGVHLEGPFLSPKYPGAQSATHIRRPDVDEFMRLVEAGPVRMITLAPEAPGAHELIRCAVERNIVAVAGHTAATYAEFEAGVEAGIRQATHTFNAMTGLHHREPGAAGATLTDDRVYAQLIADTIHVHPAAMDVLARCKGSERVLLITDASRATGLPPGEYELGGQPVAVRDRESRLADGTLAGSVLTMERGLANFMAATGWSLAKAWPASSRNAADALGLRNMGRIAARCVADLVVLDAELKVVATVVNGRVVYLHEQDRARLPAALIGLYDGEDHVTRPG